MILLPYDNIVYKTGLKKDEIIKRLSEQTTPKMPWTSFYRRSSKTYAGDIQGHTFEIQRINYYRNSFKPMIHGIIEEDYDGTRVKVSMRLHVVVIIFLCIWCCAVGSFWFTALNEVLRGSTGDSQFSMFSGMLIAVYAMTIFGFKFESYKSKNDLKKLFEAEIIED